MTTAVVLIEAERDAMSALGGALADLDGVAEAYSVTGEWDFVAIIRVPPSADIASRSASMSTTAVVMAYGSRPAGG